MQDHEFRHVLNDEIHGRPGLAVMAPARITHLAFTLTKEDSDPFLQVAKLCDAFGVKAPAEGARHHSAELAFGLFKYERHGEFYRISVTAQNTRKKQEAIALLPLGWIDGLPGKRLVAIHTEILSSEMKQPTAAFLKKYFGHEDLAASRVSHGRATVWTDFKIGDDGYTRILVQDHGMTPLSLGRVSRRIHEIETYRMMALLAFPLALDLQRRLGSLEKALAETIEGMLSTHGIDEDARLLASLSTTARDVEEMSNRSSFRFAAARAYSALVAKRVAELGEERTANYQRIGVFLDRRFSPAMTTCFAVAERIADLARRSERASNLLRTRVDIALEGQNQQLLRSMESRARQQLMLQETVEGISVVAISYYLFNIVEIFVNGAARHFFGESVHFPDWALVPVILLFVWWGIRRLKRRIRSSYPDTQISARTSSNVVSAASPLEDRT
ncbi:MAG: DUF3422 domain-containing protein [Aestuariivirga sp.]